MGSLVIPLGYFFRNQLGNGHGDSRRGKGQQHGVDGIGHPVQAHPLIPDEPGEGDPVQGAEYFREDPCGSQDKGPGHEGLFFHKYLPFSPYILPSLYHNKKPLPRKQGKGACFAPF